MSDAAVATGAVVGPRRRRRRTPFNLVIGGLLISLVVAMGVVSFFWTPFNPTRTNVADQLLGPGKQGHLLGTDIFGKDIFSGIMVGARTALQVGFIAVGIAMILGVPLGAIAALRRGWAEEVVMRSSDILLAFPALLLAIMLTATLGRSTTTAMIAIGIAYTPIFARITRGSGIQVMQLDYVTAARASGRKPASIFLRHVLPNIRSALIVQATVSFALAILAEAALSYLGLGTQLPTPSWGRMLNDAQNYIPVEPLLAVWPGVAIAVTVLGFNLLGDGLRDALDPKLEVTRA